VAQATWYRRHRISPSAPRPAPVPHNERAQPRALATAERKAILDALHSRRFADLASDEVWATLLDEGSYLGSVSTYYRVLREAGESRERRVQAAHSAAVKPELVATGPNQVYSWDITKLHGPAKWAYHHLYVILDMRWDDRRLCEGRHARWRFGPGLVMTMVGTAAHRDSRVSARVSSAMSDVFIIWPGGIDS
jgi:putative transposase